MFKQEILDHYRHPRNFGDLKNKTHQARGTNASCGDVIEIALSIVDGRVVAVAFQGTGCALSTAAASMLTERIKGLTKAQVKKLDKGVMEELIGKVNPGRQKCVELPLEVVSEAIDSPLRD